MFPLLLKSAFVEDPQADLKPLEEDAEKEGHYYGKSELESGKFLPRLKKSGMEKSAQIPGFPGGVGRVLPAGERSPCLECSMAGLSRQAWKAQKQTGKIMAQCEEETNHPCSCRAGCQLLT